MEFKRFTKKNIIINTLLAILYLIWSHFAGGIRPEHYFLVFLWFLMYYTHEKTRRFILGFSIFIIYWIIYDSMRILPNYEVSTVHIKQPYELEKFLFGITFQHNLMTPNEYFELVHTKFLDLISGLFYINWVPIPIAFGVYLYFTDKTLFTKFSVVFLLVNIFGFIIYYIYPAAPPWYVKLYGFDLHFGVPGNTAGLGRFDKLTGIPIFAGLYEKNANVLAAMPSLHASYPVIVVFYAIKKRLAWVNIFFVLFMLGIWFSAVYSGHHYIIDILAGATLALIVLFAFEKILKKPQLNQLIHKFVKNI